MRLDLFGAGEPEAGDGRIAILAVVLPALGAAGAWVASQLWAVWQKRTDRAEKRELSLVELERDLRKAAECDRDEEKERADDKAEQLSRCRIAAAQRLLQIRHYERVLAANRISFEKYTETAGEDFGNHIHKALRPDDKSPDAPQPDAPKEDNP